MNISFLIPNGAHYKMFFRGINDSEKVLVLGKQFSLVKKMEKLFSRFRRETLLYKITICLIKRKIDIANTDVLVLTDLSQKKMPRGFIKWMKQRNPSITYVLLFYNKVSTLYGLAGNIDMDDLPEKEIMLPFDKIFTYDIEEATRFGFENYIILSDIRDVVNIKAEEHDIFYCGGVGASWKMGRYYEIDKIYQFLKSNHVDCDFYLVFNKKKDMPICEYASLKRLSYVEMMGRTLASKVILDVVSNNKRGVSPRFYDALMYNKKYLTNNPTITSHPLYNSQYMKVYDDTRDIDINWLMKDEIVDYHYDGYYTPDGFYRKMCDALSTKE